VEDHKEIVVPAGHIDFDFGPVKRTPDTKDVGGIASSVTLLIVIDFRVDKVKVNLPFDLS
jgi:hypothetical protein